MTAARGEMLSLLGSVEKVAIRVLREVHEGLKEKLSQLWKQLNSVFPKKAICMRVGVDQAVHKVVLDATAHNQDVQKNVRSELSKDVEVAVSNVDDACKEPASKVSGGRKTFVVWISRWLKESRQQGWLRYRNSSGEESSCFVGAHD